MPNSVTQYFATSSVYEEEPMTYLLLRTISTIKKKKKKAEEAHRDVELLVDAGRSRKRGKERGKNWKFAIFHSDRPFLGMFHPDTVYQPLWRKCDQ